MRDRSPYTKGLIIIAIISLYNMLSIDIWSPRLEVLGLGPVSQKILQIVDVT